MHAHILDTTRAHEKMLRGFGQTTAEVTYQRPLETKQKEVATTLFGMKPKEGLIALQTFTWQFEDLAPKFPRLVTFLEYWDKHCAIAPIDKVRFAHVKLATELELRCIESKWYIN